jgi:hypothetical protein
MILTSSMTNTYRRCGNVALRQIKNKLTRFANSRPGPDLGVYCPRYRLEP